MVRIRRIQNPDPSKTTKGRPPGNSRSKSSPPTHKFKSLKGCATRPTRKFTVTSKGTPPFPPARIKRTQSCYKRSLDFSEGSIESSFRHERRINHTSKQKMVPPSNAAPKIPAPMPSQTTPPAESSARKKQKTAPRLNRRTLKSCRPLIRNAADASSPRRTPCHPCNSPTEKLLLLMD
jgi:hypothetical protein